VWTGDVATADTADAVDCAERGDPVLFLVPRRYPHMGGEWFEVSRPPPTEMCRERAVVDGRSAM
jgi:hypothetical protein